MSTIADPSVYKLQKQTDDPRFEGFGTAGAKSIRGRSFLTQDFLPDALTNWKPPRLSPIWKPLKVVGRVRESNDYPCVSLTIPAFSRKAVDALREFLTQNGELLPLVSEVGLFFAYNITTLVDAFDPEHSEADWINEWVAALIHRYEFFPDQLEGLTIFQFPQDPGQPYVTEPFVARARAAGLQGMHFKKVWPTDDQAAELENQHRRAVGAMKGQCVVIGLKLKGSKVATAEKKALTQLTDEISQLLVNPAKERVAPAVGYLETCGFSAGECVIKLSCPDSAALVEVLRPLLSQFRWPVPIQVLRRNGSFEDDTATQQSVTI